MTRVRIRAGLAIPEGVYEHADERLAAIDWDQLRGAIGVELECDRHVGRWWPAAATTVTRAQLPDWRCPACARSFRAQLTGRGGTPQF